MYLCLNLRYWETGSDCVSITYLYVSIVVWQWRFSNTTQVPLHQLNGIQQTVQCLSRLAQIIKSLCGTWQWRGTTKQKGKEDIWMFLHSYCSFTWYANLVCLRKRILSVCILGLSRSWNGLNFARKELKGVDDGPGTDLGRGCRGAHPPPLPPPPRWSLLLHIRF